MIEDDVYGKKINEIQQIEQVDKASVESEIEDGKKLGLI